MDDWRSCRFGNSGVGKPGTDGELDLVIDIAEGKIADTVDFKRGVRPHCAVMAEEWTALRDDGTGERYRGD